MALFFGMIDFSSVAQASSSNFQSQCILVSNSSLLHVWQIGYPVFDNQCWYRAIGVFSATTTGSMDRMPTDEELDRWNSWAMVSVILSVHLFGGLPTANIQPECRILYLQNEVVRAVW